jgi:hypothetical protein
MHVHWGTAPRKAIGEETMESTGHETCDKCGPGTDARVGVDLNTGGTLYFCQHHYNELAEKLAPIAVFVGQLGELAAAEGQQS